MPVSLRQDASRGTGEAVIQGTVTVSGSNALDSLVFNGFTIQSGMDHGIGNVRLQDGGIYNNIIRGDWVSGNSPSNRGIFTASSSPVVVQSWELIGNDIQGYRYAISLDGNSQLSNGVVRHNYLAKSQRGIQSIGLKPLEFTHRRASITITENTITDNEQGIRLAGGIRNGEPKHGDQQHPIRHSSWRDGEPD
jgi:hypothetical protein